MYVLVFDVHHILTFGGDDRGLPVPELLPLDPDQLPLVLGLLLSIGHGLLALRKGFLKWQDTKIKRWGIKRLVVSAFSLLMSSHSFLSRSS